ncbi:MAG: hypothetical protein II987_07650 [Clostridia bacterium]|nr:hypothetical protein [Clostridia bacterium]
MIFSNREACEFIESDLFLLLIIDATAYMVWPYMGHSEYMEIYSGYDPAWILAHSPGYWVQELIDEGIVPTVNNLFQNCNEEFGYVTEEELDVYLRYVVPRAMKKHNMNATIQIAEEFRCFEDFDFRNSRPKTDFHRKWYHTRTKHPMISLEEFKENYAENHNGQEWDEPDTSQDVEENVTSEILVEQFKATLTEKDMAILQMRMEGDTLEEIAEKLGYKTHSGVLKRIRKIGLAFEEFTGEDYGFENRKIT